MKTNNPEARESILNKIRNGLKSSKFKKIEECSFDANKVYVSQNKPVIELFRDELVKVSGQFFYCNNIDEAAEKLESIHKEIGLGLCYCPNADFETLISKTSIPHIKVFERTEEIKSGISNCEYLIARFGSVMVSSALPGGRRIFSFPEIHIVIATENQIVLEIGQALDAIMQKYGNNLPSQITNITGPSRTADIEKTLILGAHGPKKLMVFVLKNL